MLENRELLSHRLFTIVFLYPMFILKNKKALRVGLASGGFCIVKTVKF